MPPIPPIPAAAPPPPLPRPAADGRPRPPRPIRAKTATLARLADIRGIEYMLDCIKNSRPCVRGCKGGEARLFTPSAHAALRQKWQAIDAALGPAHQLAIRQALHAVPAAR